VEEGVEMIGWIGTVASVIGSFVVAFQIFVVGYALFLIGSVSWLWVAVKTRNLSLGVLNGFFMAANIIGLWRSI
jgi:hypothetical protein